MASERLRFSKHILRELRELGLANATYRIGRELLLSSGLGKHLDHKPITRSDLPILESTEVAKTLGLRPVDEITSVMALYEDESIGQEAEDTLNGRIRCFGHDLGDFSRPIAWHRDPHTGFLWNSTKHWSEAFSPGHGDNDVKWIWEIGRFPQVCAWARAAARQPHLLPRYRDALRDQILSFVASNPYPMGVHWASGQEIALRVLAWLVGSATLQCPILDLPLIRAHIHDSILHIERHVGFARRAVHNNHLLSESLALLVAGMLFRGHRKSASWLRTGKALLDEGVRKQFYADGGYIQQSHNYHRFALDLVCWAVTVVENEDPGLARSWREAISRSVDFLVSHQDESSGWLPNYGNNDGARLWPLSACAFPDFRPSLQAAALVARGERLYAPGPWDEQATWLLGPDVVGDARIRRPVHTTVAFPTSGHYVIRSSSKKTFATLRCGTLKDRFSQIDMLHVDYWWRGENILCDAGSYLYNGPRVWHDHFIGGKCHNTVTVDGVDQMLHFRQFKMLYPAPASVDSFETIDDVQVVAGYHRGFEREVPGVVHHRSLMLRNDILVVIDEVSGDFRSARLHWLCGPYEHTVAESGIDIKTRSRSLAVRLFDGAGESLRTSVVAGQSSPPRGWLSRYYGSKKPTPSLVTSVGAQYPSRVITVVAPEQALLKTSKGVYSAGNSDETLHWMHEGTVPVPCPSPSCE